MENKIEISEWISREIIEEVIVSLDKKERKRGLRWEWGR